MADKMITFRSTEEFHRHMKLEAHRISVERQEDLNVTDLIREALFEKYPMCYQSYLK